MKITRSREKAIVRKIESLLVQVELLDFPDCNWKEIKNRFWFTHEEVSKDDMAE